MANRSVALIVAVALIGGCAHVRRVGRPPSQAELDDINGSASGEPGTFTVRYFEPGQPCDGTCTVEGPRPAFDIPPSEIARIASVDAGRMTVVAQTGEIWHLELSRVAGVTTRHRATLAGAISGGAFGLGMGGLMALAASGPFLDATPSYSQMSQSSSALSSVGIVATFTALGALLGALVGHAMFARDSFELGDTGLSSEPSSEFGR